MGKLAMLARPEGRDAVKLSDPNAWTRIFGGTGKSASGVTVTHEDALSSAAMFQGVRLISETLATVPLKIYQTDGRSKSPAREHHLYEILHDEPNEEQTAVEFRGMLVAFAVLMGTGYAHIIRDGGNRPRELWPITPHRVTPERDPVTHKLRYRVRTHTGQNRIVRWEDMYVLRGFGLNGVLGEDVVHRMREAIGLGLAMEKFGARFFGSGTQLSGVAQHPGRLTPEAQRNLRTSMEEEHQGLEKSHRVMILEEGMTWQATGVPPEAAQFLESRKFHVSEVARILNVQPHLLMDLERATFSNIEHQFGEFVAITVRPWAVRIEQAMRKKLLSDAEKESRALTILHQLEGLLRGDSAARAAFYTAMFNIGAMSPNDVNEIEDRNPVEGGDQRFVPLNMVPLERAGEPDPPRTTRDPDDDRAAPAVESRDRMQIERRDRSVEHRRRLRSSFRRLFLAAGERLVSRDVNAIRQLSGKHLSGAPDGIGFLEALESHLERQESFARDEIRPIVAGLAEEIEGVVAEELDTEPDGREDERDRFVNGYASAFAVGEVANTRGQIRALVRDTPEAEVREVVEGRLDDWEETRAGKIADRQVVESSSALVRSAYLAAGVSQLVWVASGSDTCPICRDLSGKVVGREGTFANSGDTINDGDESVITFRRTVRHPPAHGGCVCDIAPA